MSAAGGAVVQAIFGFRLLAVLGLGLAAWAIPRLARSHGTDPADALIVVLGNPITLVHLVSGAHNEALMIGLLLAGLAVGRRRILIGIVLCSLAASIKVPAVLGALFMGWQWARDAPTRWAQAARLAITAAVPLLTLAWLGRLTGWGWGWVPAVTANRTIDSNVALGNSTSED